MKEVNAKYSEEITGVILAGGKSKRMGQDKALLPLAGKSMIEIVIDRMASLFNSVKIIAGRTERYTDFGVPVLKDAIPDFGPLGGIFTALKETGAEFSFIVGCDMPFINMELVWTICEKRAGTDLVVPKIKGFFEPLFGIYAKTCLPAIEKLISEKNPRIYDFYDQVNTYFVSSEEVEECDPEGLSFVNINTYDEYEMVRNQLLKHNQFDV